MKALLPLYLLFIHKFVVAEIKTPSTWPKERIVGGEVARVGQFPYSAAITSIYSNGNYFCGGALISNQWILTAAQCILGAIQFRIQLGSNSLDSTDPNRVTVITSTRVTHPDYNSDTLEHDIGLIRLRLAVDLNEYMSAINLPLRSLESYSVVTAVGWGPHDDQNTGLANDLHFVELVTITNNECKAFYGEQILDSMICVAGQYNEGTCTGDSGGPLIEYRTERAAVHVGVSTFISGNGCESLLPSGFTRTYHYVDWIRDITGITN